MMLKVLLALTFIAAVSADDHDHDGDGVADHAGKGKKATDAPTEAPTDAPFYCVPQSCGTEISACYADSTCSAEYEADNDDGDDFPSEAEFKAEIENAGPKFASFLQCVWDNCVDCTEAGDCEYDYGSNALPANKGTMVMGPASTLKATMGMYPGSLPNVNPSLAAPSGTVAVEDQADGSLKVFYKLQFGAGVADGGLHIHTGMTCDDAVTVGGHYWTPTTSTDPWSTTYMVDAGGNAEGSFTVDSGYQIDGNTGHAVVVHNSDGVRVGCGVLAVAALPANKGTMVMAPYSGGGPVGEAEATGGDDTGYGGDDTGEAKVTVVEHDHDGDGVADHMGKEGKASKDAKVAKAKKAAKAAKVAKVKSVKAAHDHAAEVAAPMKFTALATTVADNKMAFTSVASVGVLAVAAAIFVRRRRSGYNAIEADEELETDEASNLLV